LQALNGNHNYQKNVSRVARVLYAALETKEKCIRDAFNTEALDSCVVVVMRRIIMDNEIVVVVVDAAVALKMDRKEMEMVVQVAATSTGANTVGIVEIR